MLHVSGMLKKHNSRIRGSKNPHETRKLERYTPTVKVWCQIMHDKINEPSSFAEKSIAAQIYLDVLTENLVPQLEEYQSLVFPAGRCTISLGFGSLAISERNISDSANWTQ